MVVRLRLRRNRNWDEWSVRWYEDHRLIESRCYYTDSRDDAIATMRSLCAMLLRDGYRTSPTDLFTFIKD